MKLLHCDVAIIGAGSAGLAARRKAVEAGARVLLIEKGPYGTTCARVGCMPSKLLIRAARAAVEARAGRPLGVGPGAMPRISGTAVMERVRCERDHFVAGVLKEVAEIPKAEKLDGHARFLDATTLTVDDHTRVEARAVVIATGAAPATPAALQDACGERLVTHETVFELKRLPKSLAVIGAGPLGLELALAFRRLGVRTWLFDEGDAVGGVKDPAVAAAVRDWTGDQLDLRLGVKVDAKLNAAGDVHVSWRDASGRSHRGTFEYVLDAAGRPPALDNLDLKMAGLERDEGGIPVFDPRTMQCGKAPVFIAGDANDSRPVLHEAAHQGEVAGANAARFPKVEPQNPGVPLAITYTEPDLAMVGPPFDETEAKAWVIGESAENGRARIEAVPAGLLRVYVRREDKALIGGALFGPQVEHLAHLLAWAVQMELTVEDVLALPYYHPTFEEGLRAALRDAAAKL